MPAGPRALEGKKEGASPGAKAPPRATHNKLGNNKQCTKLHVCTAGPVVVKAFVLIVPMMGMVPLEDPLRPHKPLPSLSNPSFLEFMAITLSLSSLGVCYCSTAHRAPCTETFNSGQNTCGTQSTLLPETYSHAVSVSLGTARCGHGSGESASEPGPMETATHSSSLPPLFLDDDGR